MFRLLTSLFSNLIGHEVYYIIQKPNSDFWEHETVKSEKLCSEAINQHQWEKEIYVFNMSRTPVCFSENSICLSVKIISSGFSFLNSCSRIKVDVDPFLLGKDLELNILSKLEESLQNDEGNDNISQLKNHMQMKLIYKAVFLFENANFKMRQKWFWL